MTIPLYFIKNELVLYKEEKKIFRKVPKFAPAGQSTQMIVGATNETDLKIIKVADHFYQNYNMKRVYYSGYVPMIEDSRLPSVFSQVPMQRENRLYQADWLMRFYGFDANEILDQQNPFLDLEVDPKLAWALRNREKFPVNINTAPKEMLLRIPGVGVTSVLKILQARRFQKLNLGHLKKMGVATNRAKYFIEFESENIFNRLIDEQNFRQIVLNGMKSKWQNPFSEQLSLF